jgi:hypothetical protein
MKSTNTRHGKITYPTHILEQAMTQLRAGKTLRDVSRALHRDAVARVALKSA